MKTFEILIGSGPARSVTTLRTTLEGVLEYFRPGRPDLKMVKRGYTTWRLYEGGTCVGSVQEL